jgi:hypothetical protein
VEPARQICSGLEDQYPTRLDNSSILVLYFESEFQEARVWREASLHCVQSSDDDISRGKLCARSLILGASKEGGKTKC